MQLLAPFWLALLVPWLLLAIWLWRREVKHVSVAGRFLWPETASKSTRDSERSLPPVWTLIGLLALLALIVALASPMVSASRSKLSVIVDSHVTMGLHVAQGRVLDRLLDELEADLRGVDDVMVSYLFANDSDPVLRDRLPDTTLTGAATRERIESLCERHRGEAIVVLSAQQLTLPQAVIRYAPGEPNDVRIIRIAASIEPSPQVMVTFAHRVDAEPFDVSIGSNARHRIVPDTSAVRTTRFFDLDVTTGETMTVRIEGARSAPGFDRASLARAGSWPRVEVEGGVPPAAERFAAAFSKARPADGRSRVVRFSSSLDNQKGTLCFAAATRPIEPQWVSLPSLGASHASNIEARVSAIAGAPPGFETLLRVNDVAVVAVDRAKRQVWVGFDVTDFAQTPGWVAWVNGLVAFASEDDHPRWESVSVDAIGADWTPVEVDDPIDASPGIYRASEGDLRAANVAEVELATNKGPRRERLVETMERSRRERGMSLQRHALGVATVLALFGGVLMGGRKL